MILLIEIKTYVSINNYSVLKNKPILIYITHCHTMATLMLTPLRFRKGNLKIHSFVHTSHGVNIAHVSYGDFKHLTVMLPEMDIVFDVKQPNNGSCEISLGLYQLNANHRDLATMLEECDDLLVSRIVENNEFKLEPTSNNIPTVKCLLNNTVKKPNLNIYPDYIRCKIPIKGDEVKCPMFDVDGQQLEQSFDSLKKLKKGTTVKAFVCINRAYTTGGKCGYSLQIQQLKIVHYGKSACLIE